MSNHQTVEDRLETEWFRCVNRLVEDMPDLTQEQLQARIAFLTDLNSTITALGPPDQQEDQ
jgi:hypothetical protein